MSYSIDEAKNLVIRAGKELLESGLIARTWGNISARISPTQCVVSPSGKAYDSLTPDDIVVINIADGKAADPENTVKPSSEKGVHAAAYRLRPDVNFVIHTHQDYATDMSILGRQFHIGNVNPMLKKRLGPFIPTARYALSSTKKLENHVSFTIRKYPQARSVLMRNHGTLCMGADYDDAFKIARALEKVCKMKYKQTVFADYPEQADKSASLSKYATVLNKEIHEEYDRHYLTFENDQVGCVIEAATPFIMKMSSYGEDMRVYVDDLAQIAGTRIRCLPEDADEKMIARALSGASGAVLIQGKGAVCTGRDFADAEAAMMVLDKGCQAALLARSIKISGDSRKAKPVSKADGALEHLVYTKKYSKLKDREDESC